MKDKILILFIGMLLVACDERNDKKLYYKDADFTYFVTTKTSEKDGEIDTLYFFHDPDKISKVEEVGFYKHGFRNGVWNYKIHSGIKTIKWGHYKDKYLGFQTSLFSFIDSIKYSESSSKFLFNGQSGRIILTISISNPQKDSITSSNTLNNYIGLVKKEFHKQEIKLLNYNSYILKKKQRRIFIIDMSAKSIHKAVKYIQIAICYLDKDNFIEISVGSEDKDDFYSKKLFNAVLTDFRINNMRLYNPFEIL